MQAPLAVLTGLALTLGLSRLRLPLGPAFLAGAAALGLVSGSGAAGTASHFADILAGAGLWVFLAAVAGVFVLSAVLRLNGSLDVLVRTSGVLFHNNRLRVASLPALVGLLPMPGGAVVSAPLVQRTGGDLTLGSRDKNLINYWFRHVWEVFWPLYPAMLLAASISRAPLEMLVLLQLPLGLLMVLLGYAFILRPVPGGVVRPGAGGVGTAEVARALLPLLVVLLGMPVAGGLLEGLVPREVSGLVGLAAAVPPGIAAALLLRGGLPVLGAALRERRTWGLLVLAMGVKAFGDMVGASGAAGGTAAWISATGLPLAAAGALLPFFVGFAAGNTLVFVTVSFPVLHALGGGAAAPWTAHLPVFVLGYAMGYAGYMLSPVHLCLVLSSRYFSEPVGRAYGRLAWPMGIFVACALGLALVLSAVFP